MKSKSIRRYFLLTTICILSFSCSTSTTDRSRKSDISRAEIRDESYQIVFADDSRIAESMAVIPENVIFYADKAFNGVISLENSDRQNGEIRIFYSADTPSPDFEAIFLNIELTDSQGNLLYENRRLVLMLDKNSASEMRSISEQSYEIHRKVHTFSILGLSWVADALAKELFRQNRNPLSREIRPITVELAQYQEAGELKLNEGDEGELHRNGRNVFPELSEEEQDDLIQRRDIVQGHLVEFEIRFEILSQNWEEFQEALVKLKLDS